MSAACHRSQRRTVKRGAARGQAATETLIVTVALVLVAGLVSWGDGGLLGLWLDALEQGFAQFAAALAVPV